MPPVRKGRAQVAEVDLARTQLAQRPGQPNEPGPASYAPSRHASRLPEAIHFPLVVVLSFAIAGIGYTFLGELATVLRPLNTWTELGILVGWRIIELGVGWVGNYDSLDMASLDLQAHGPFLYLLSSFYGISATTALLALAVDLLSTAIPFHLLRPLSGPHSGNAKVNQDIIADIYIQASTTLLAASIYGVAIVSAFRTFLPKQLVLYFSSIQSVRPAYEASYVTLFPIALVFGLTAHTFIFTPFAATDKAEEDDQLAKFDPVSATLNETVYYNVWGFATKTKVAILRTAVLATVSGVSTYLQCAMAINGVESPGAAAYAGIWAVPGLLSGLALGLVGGV